MRPKERRGTFAKRFEGVQGLKQDLVLLDPLRSARIGVPRVSGPGDEAEDRQADEDDRPQPTAPGAQADDRHAHE